MIPQKQDMTTRRNDSFSCNISFYECDGTTPWYSMSAYTHTMQVKDNNNCTILTFSGDNITCCTACASVNLFKGFNEMNMTACSYNYDYQLQQDSTCQRLTFIQGNFTITKDITN